MLKTIKKTDFFLLYAALFQIWFAVVAVRYHDVVVIGPSYAHPKMSQEYWEWFLDVREPIVPYENTLVTLCELIQLVSVLLLFVGLVVLFARQKSGKYLNQRCWMIGGGIVLIIYGVSIIWRQQCAEPYYLYMELILPEILSLFYLIQVAMEWVNREKRGVE